MDIHYIEEEMMEGQLKLKKGHTIHLENVNQWAVPYNKYLVKKYVAHFNLEICSLIKAIKYIYKYILKGNDKMQFQL